MEFCKLFFVIKYTVNLYKLAVGFKTNNNFSRSKNEIL